MSRRQRRAHAHLRRMRAIKAGRPLPRVKPKRAHSLIGHWPFEERFGDGWSTPVEAYRRCCCGVFLWEYMQGLGCREWMTWAEHVSWVRHNRRPLLHNGRKGRG